MATRQKTQTIRRALDALTAAGTVPKARGGLLGVAGASRGGERPRSWTLDESIQGFGIAPRITQGRKLGDLALKVYVDRKLPLGRVENPVPKTVEIPGIDEAVETDVEAIGKVELEINTGRHRPAMPGCGVGHFEVEVGTFGCLVRKRGPRCPRGQTEPLYVLSNSHVLANHGVCQAGDVILQSGRHDGGREPDDVLGELAEWVPFQFTEDGFPNLVDAAIARVRKPEEITSRVNLIGVPKGVSTVVRRGMMVRKSGRTTDLTVGEIKDVDYRLTMSYKRPEGGFGRAGLSGQVLCTRFTAPGDSGAAVFNMDGHIVGLHFAGSSSSSIFNRIGNVLDALDIEVVTEEI
jgi:hypothetical protein